MIVNAGESKYQLTYCTNIHPANGWASVLANLKTHAPELRRRLAPEQPFALGIRLSAAEAAELLAGSALEDFSAFLSNEKLYVALINGFPFGSFHKAAVKEQVFAPDWRSSERVDYTKDLFEILRRLMPEATDGGVSTCPLSYKRWIKESDLRQITSNVLQICEYLVRLKQDSGRSLHLDVEPEPDGLLETAEEFVQYFEQNLLHEGIPRIAAAFGISHSAAEASIREHIAVCFDTCHSAVEYELPVETLARYRAAGIRIGRIQVSSAIQCNPRQSELREFCDSTYLHQVIASRGAGIRTRYADLPEAFRSDARDEEEWRVHFHVPIFTSHYAGLNSTQDQLRTVMQEARRHQLSTHLEIETYTWDVLPAELKLDLIDSIEREYRWLMSTLETA